MSPDEHSPDTAHTNAQAPLVEVTPHYTPEEIAKAARAESWHRRTIVGALLGAAFYLATSIVPAMHGIQTLGAWLVFFLVLTYFATSIWVSSLRSERRRSAKEQMEAVKRTGGVSDSP